jgi:3-dehydroquinate dehydratase-2
MPAHILVLHGPNLNLLGTREPEIYGHATLDGINQSLHDLAAEGGAQLATFQSNHEGALVDRIQAARADGTTHIVINAGAYTHTSVAIRDALSALDKPVIEVHLSNVYQREPFRHHSYLSDIATAVIAGLGAEGYRAAVRSILQQSE